LGWVGSTVSKICFILDFILHTAYSIDICVFSSILPSLSLIDTLYCMADKSDAVVGSVCRRRF